MDARSVLVLNAGSSSLKWVVLDSETEAIRQHGDTSWPVNEAGRHEREMAAALQQVDSADAVGHRVVHGGEHFRDAVLIDEGVREQIAELADLAPLHNPAAVAGIDAVRSRFPNVPQVAAFDTAFHATLPDVASTYPLPWDWTARWGLRRFGFHGLSVSYAATRVRELLGALPSRLVVCHLGAGCSVTAVADGKSIDTSMGFTPLEGLMMAKRSGSVDPGLLVYLLERQGVTSTELDTALNEQSGLLGVSGVSADMREVLSAAGAGNDRARLARDLFVRRIVTTIGGMLPPLGGLDALVFTGGIGEHSGLIRAGVCSAFGFIGLSLDGAVNQATVKDGEISQAGSAVRVLVITAREDLAILRQVRRVLGW